ncbi:hypothetical protein LWC34_53890 [Kibdelosporangium philippinense]|uniref:Transcriptional regulator, AbiEi antitoxin, Type IV TA system n=1 Tax=Kibdelosporangium philippinense TaxID=211113 RepID=A0ABS8ZXY8_9PSEU|nr:hypothetical protein [Kibdelosporangium philippinense]MCE7011651.1 hypothetical protein [Kibdelosporangium philippinense]
MRNRHPIDLEALSTLFPHRIASAADLIDLGLTGTTVKRRCSPGGPWQRLLPGILLLDSTAPTREQLVQAALRYAGRDAIVTGADALALHGARTAIPGGRIHLLMPCKRFVRSSASVLVERTASPPRPVLRNGLLTAPLARAAVDTARRIDNRALVAALFAEMVFHKGIRLDELNTEVVMGKRRGSTLCQEVLHDIGERIRAGVASSARDLVLRAGLPPPQWNVPVDDARGNPLGTVTGAWDDAKLAWDVHAFDFDPAPASYPTALKRGSRLAATGLLVLHTPAAQLRSDPEGVIADLTAIFAQAHAESCPSS